VVAVGLIVIGLGIPGVPKDDQNAPEGDTPTGTPEALASLAWLAGMGDLAGMRERIEGGADVNAPASADEPALAGLTPLMAAARNGAREAVVLLLSTGADPNAAGESDRTALMVAAEAGHAQIVKDLLEAGAKPNAATTSGRTALMMGAAGKEPDVVILLLSAGADPSVKDAAGRRAIDLASGRSDSSGLAIAAVLREADG
jgi:ankyrin repeat protein